MSEKRQICLSDGVLIEYHSYYDQASGVVATLPENWQGETFEFPEEIEGTPVVQIERLVVEQYLRSLENSGAQPSLRNVVIPKCVEEIDIGAFSDLPQQARFQVAEENSFYRAVDGALTTKDGTSLIRGALGPDGSAVIPKGVKDLERHAFSEFASLTGIVIPQGVVTIGAYTFCNCTSLKGIVIPESVESIALFFSETMAQISDLACFPQFPSYDPGIATFGKCDALTLFEVDENNPNYRSVDGALTLKEGLTLAVGVVRADGSAVIPQGVKTIAGYAFYRRDSLKTAVVPQGVEKINYYAFAFCTSLINAVIPQGVVKLGASVFFGCSSLIDVDIPSGVEEIREAAFCGCSSLPEIVVPDGVKRIEKNVFKCCDALKRVVIPPSVEEIEDAFDDRAPNLTICGIPGSQAEKFANAHGYKFATFDVE